MTDGLVPVEYLSAYEGRVEGEQRRVDPASAKSLLDRGVVRLRPDGEDPAAPEAPPVDPEPVLPLAPEHEDPEHEDPEPEF